MLGYFFFLCYNIRIRLFTNERDLEETIAFWKEYKRMQ